MDAKAIANGLGSEHPHVVALVLSSLETEQAAAVVGLLPEALRNDAMLRVATLEDIPSGALIELNEIIEKQVMSSISAAATSEVGGPKRAAEILAFLDGDIESAILDKVKEVDTELGEEIENLMLAFESLVQVDDRGIQALLREVTSETLMIALRGADEIVRAKNLRNMSKRASEKLRDDLEAMPPVRLSDVEKAQREILYTAKRLADAGELSLGGKGGDGFV
jgi:flagellar motor switch protein FliG